MNAHDQIVGVVDYGLGNLLSVVHALQFLGHEPVICRSPDAVSACDRLVLPGVGAFGEGMKNLHERGFVEALGDAVLNEKKPILGICLGMQLMASRGFEGGDSAGLGWLEGDVVRLPSLGSGCRVPNVGWSEVTFERSSFLFHQVPPRADFYFVHSFHLRVQNVDVVQGTAQNGVTFTAAVQKQNIFGAQFHPEKSQRHGLTVLSNFLAWDRESLT